MLTTGITWGSILFYDASQNPTDNPQMGFATNLFLYVVIPSLLAGISAFFIGADLLNSAKVRTAWQAAIRGLYVSIPTWLAFVLILSFVMTKSPNESFFNAFVYVLLLFSIAVGWLFAAVGIITGLLLYKSRDFIESCNQS